MNASVHLHVDDDQPPYAVALTIGPGRHFISLTVGGINILLPTGDAETLASARAIAAALTACADTLEAELRDAEVRAFEAQAAAPIIEADQPMVGDYL